METHYMLKDEEFILQFKNATLNPELFNHEAHLRLAWIFVKTYGIDEAIMKIGEQLKNYVTSLGARDKYNETVTVVGVRVIHHFMLKSKTDDFKDFMIEFPRLKSNFKDLLSQHYSFNIFNYEEAKLLYIEPDLLPFN